ncbi:exonuclease SbcC [bacterium A37T11]|nr:exonuclease SbcC [bacterium A37T11]
MIPISLTIQGLYSYQQPQTIQFDRLIDAQLFGIFGAVGSGKSSILEAISFALYGETERLNNRDNRAYNMMNLKSNELLIDFVFRNHDEQVYRFLVKGKRHGKDFDKVNTFERTAYRWVESLWRPLESNMATELLGLTYENFRRTIIIPQGKFQEFLQLGDKERSNMLKEIFQLHKYEFFYQTTSLERKNNESLNQLKGKLSGYEEEDEELLDSKSAQLKAEEKLLTQQQEALRGQELKFQLLDRLKGLHEERVVQLKKLQSLEARKGYYEGLETQLNAYEYARDHFKETLRTLQDNQNQLGQSQQQRDKTLQQLTAVEERLHGLQEGYQLAADAFSRLEDQTLLLQDYQTLRQLHGVKQELGVLNGRMEKGTQVVASAREAKTTAEEIWQQQKQNLAAARASIPDTSMVVPMTQWYHTRDNYQRQYDALEKQRDAIRLLVGQTREQLQEAKVKDTDKEALQQLLQQQSDVMHHIKIQLKLGEYSQALQPGFPCPLCGATDHPQLLEMADVQEQLLLVEAQQRQTQRELDAHQASVQAAGLLKERLRGYEEQETRLQQEMNQLTRTMYAHKEAFGWPDFDPMDAGLLQSYVEQVALDKKHVEELEQAVEKAEQRLTKSRTELERYESILQKLTLEQASLAAGEQTLCGQLQKLHAGFLEETDVTALDALISQLKSELSLVKQRYEESRTSLDEYRLRRSTLVAQENTMKEQQEVFMDLGASLRMTLDEALSSSSFTSLDQVKEVLAQELKVSSVRAELNAFLQQLHSAAQLLELTQQKLDGHEFDAPAFGRLMHSLEGLRQSVQEGQEQFIANKAAYARAIKRVQEKKALLKHLETIEQRAEQLSTLKNLFKGNGFVNYISTAYLHNLCQTANERFFKLTRQQLRLEINEKNDFQIRDFLNNGKLRSVKTLSGGQTFQASLSLALALAESVQQQVRSRQNFFFLDEGFGSLDKESLLTAFDTLKSLRKENRIVGIISHVEELQQEIDVYLRVFNNPDQGSLILTNSETFAKAKRP